MKKLVLIAFIIAICSIASIAQNPEINIIPKPNSVQPTAGTFTLTSKTVILAADKAAQENAAVLNDLLQRNFGIRLSVKNKALRDSGIFFVTDGEETDEKYELTIDPKVIRIKGSARGQFYALQTLMQMIPADAKGEAKIPAAEISDRPRFVYRGMHLDVSRHFMPVSFVKKYIDLMSQYKMNTFHWHLTDDQGWRIEIKKYPKLTEIGARRPETMVERNFSPYIGDGKPVEGHYTQAEIKDVVAYAKARKITVIPEIELPGHASAAITAYPELGCKTDFKYKVQTTWGIFVEVFCPTETTFKFLEDVLDETIALFPDSPYIHIGGDEVLKDHWKESAFVQDLMKKENLKDEHEVQSYFIRRMEKFVNSKGKKIIGWDEILEGGLAPNATVMSWRGTKGGIEAAKAKHDVIMTPTDFLYFDYGQGDPAYEPLNIGSYVPLEKVYSFDPVPAELTPEEAKYILGGQANVWTEYLKKPENVEYMVFPRLLALSEVVWSKASDKDFTDFKRRMMPNLAYLDRQGVNYRIPEPAGLKNTVVGDDGRAVLTLQNDVPGSKVYYTTDGSAPTENSNLYTKPIEVTVPEDGITELKTIVVTAGGRRSSIYAATLVRKKPYEPVTTGTGKTAGVFYEITAFGDDGEKGFTEKGESRSIGFQQFAKKVDLKKRFTMQFDGYFNATESGVYEFQVDSTWDATIALGGSKEAGGQTMIINDAGSAERKVRSVIVPLNAGLHTISIRYGKRGDGDPSFRFRYGVKGKGLRQLYGGEFFR